jgi:hypothetical protein
MAIVKQPTKKIEFGDKDESFVKQLAKDIGCHYLQTNPHTYCLNKFNSDVQGEKGVFAWVHKEEKDYFWVSTRKIWIEAARAETVTARKPAAPSCLPRDFRQADDSVIFDTRANYDQTVSSLKMVRKIR